MTQREPLHDGAATYEDGATHEPSLSQLISGLVADSQQLVRQEIELAKRELTTEVDKAKQTAIFLGIGGALAAIGGVLLVLMLVHLLNEVVGLPLWSSYLIVGGVFALAGGLFLMRGQSRAKEIDPVPRQTVETLQEDVQWIKEQTPSGKK